MKRDSPRVTPGNVAPLIAAFGAQDSTEVRVLILGDDTRSAKLSSTPVLATGPVDTLIAAIRSGGSLALWTIRATDQQRDLLRLEIPAAEAIPVQPIAGTDVFRDRARFSDYAVRRRAWQKRDRARLEAAEQRISTFRARLPAVLPSTQNDARSAVAGALRRGDLYMAEPARERVRKVCRFAYIVSDLRATVSGEQPYEFEAPLDAVAWVFKGDVSKARPLPGSTVFEDPTAAARWLAERIRSCTASSIAGEGL